MSKNTFDRVVELGVKLIRYLENLDDNRKERAVDKEIQDAIDEMCELGYTPLVRELLEQHGFVKETTFYVVGMDEADGF